MVLLDGWTKRGNPHEYYHFRQPLSNWMQLNYVKFIYSMQIRKRGTRFVSPIPYLHQANFRSLLGFNLI